MVVTVDLLQCRRRHAEIARSFEEWDGWRLAFTIRTDSFPELQAHPRFQGLEARGYDLRALPTFRFNDAKHRHGQDGPCHAQGTPPGSCSACSDVVRRRAQPNYARYVKSGWELMASQQ